MKLACDNTRIIKFTCIGLSQNLPRSQIYKKKVHLDCILEKFQSKVLRMIVDAPLYVPNAVIKRDLQDRNTKL